MQLNMTHPFRRWFMYFKVLIHEVNFRHNLSDDVWQWRKLSRRTYFDQAGMPKNTFIRHACRCRSLCQCWHPCWIFLVAVFGLFEMFMCGFPMWLSLPGSSWHQCNEVLNRLCCVVIAAFKSCSCFLLNVPRFCYALSSRQLHSSFSLLFGFLFWRKSRLKIYKAINNSFPGGGGGLWWRFCDC